MTVIDPNSTIATAFETRVTMRGVRLTPDGGRVQVSTRSDFIAPDLSAPSTHAIESDKGKRGWTFHDVRPDVVGYEPVSQTQTASGKRGSGMGVGDHRPADLADRQLAQYRAGTPIRRNRDNGMRSTYKINKRAR